MLQEQFASLHFRAPENPIPLLAATNHDLIQQTDFNTLLNNFYVEEFPQSSTCDEAEEIQMRIIEERRYRRMVSNRESARRSRMRKQKQLDELWLQVVRLRTENNNLTDKINHVSQCRDNVVQENARLKEEVSDLRKMLTDWQMASPFTATTALVDLEDVPCNTRDESSEQSISSTSVDLLH